MQAFDEIKNYCAIVCRQMRWKKAQPLVYKEIEDHLCDQRDSYMAGGDDEKSATAKAVNQMGDAVTLGLEFDKTYRPKPQWFLLFLCGSLMLMGAFVNGFIGLSEHSLHTFNLIPYVFGFGLFILCYHWDFTWLGRYPLHIYGVVLSISVIGILAGSSINGRIFWVGSGFSVSLAYLSLIFPLAFAMLVYALRNRGYLGIILSGLGFLPFAAILMLIPTMSGLLVFTAASLIILCFAVSKGWFGINKKYGLMLVLIPTSAMLVLAGAFLFQRASHRINIILNPYDDQFGAGYMYCLIRDFLSASVFMGKGSDISGNAQISDLPFISTDYTLVYLIHELGFIVLIGICFCLLSFSAVCFFKALRQKSVLGSLTALSIILTFTLQSVIYIFDNLGYGLSSSLTLPFISYGHTALFINSALAGFMLSVFRTGDIHREQITSFKMRGSLFSYENGKLIIYLKGSQE